jgi:hypothetical protein
MAVKTRESVPSKFYTFHDVYKRGRVNASVQWKSSIGAKLDFICDYIIAVAGESRPSQIYEQMAAQFRKYLVGQERTLWEPIIIRRAETIPVQEIIGEFIESAVASLPIEVVYENQKLVEALLGNEGKVVMGKVLSLIKDSVREDNWPLTKVVVDHVKDLELEDWQYILVILIFDADLDAAEGYLRDFYKKLDILIEKLSGQEQDILKRLLYFDVQTNISEA